MLAHRLLSVLAAYVFGVLVDAEPEEIEQLLVTGRTPSNPVRVIIALARFPIDIVEDIHGGGSGPATPLIKVEQSPHRKAKQRRHSAER